MTEKHKSFQEERLHQECVCEFLDLHKILYFAVPNGGSRDVREAANMKKSGVKAGVPDLFICEPSRKFSGLFIEMKKPKNFSISENQQKWIRQLNLKGYCAIVCRGSEEAILEIRKYLS